MLDIVSVEFKIMAADYLLSEPEAQKVAGELSRAIAADALKDMFACTSRELYAREIFLRQIIEYIVANRETIKLPTAAEYQDVLIDVLEDIYDEAGLTEEMIAP